MIIIIRRIIIILTLIILFIIMSISSISISITIITITSIITIIITNITAIITITIIIIIVCRFRGVWKTIATESLHDRTNSPRVFVLVPGALPDYTNCSATVAH